MVLRDLTRVRLTNLDKILYPAAGITKADVLTYYVRAAPRLLPFLHNRPLTMHRFPDGAGGPGFFEKDAPAGTPDWVETFTRRAETAGRDVRYVLCNNLDTLIWLGNLASLEIHTALAAAPAYETPDLLLFDIDPEPPLTFDDVVSVAHIVHGQLENRGLRPYVKTSGKKGVHIVVPLVPGLSFSRVRDFAHGIGKAIARDTPQVVSEFPHSREPGTIFIDYLQNSHGKTMVAPWSLRATPLATVSVPVRWDELKKGVCPEVFNIKTVLSRHEDPWSDIFHDRQKIT
ncbi:MAG: ATP-dependent DNA ligase [Methanoregula sp. PtaU1.Bin006]|nr:MAG: ATP-dependent DNA ligase [Methanoregula sp. PtaB.Bin085]OPY32226.1 MAG: ATP-dependent DNA ligase [Methanoregula sp. PtaU1.Bin006]